MKQGQWGALVIGAVGIAVLLGLGFWQLQRLDQKQALLADIEARIAAAPVALPEQPDPEADRHLPVVASGRFTDDNLRVLASRKMIGAGYRVITPFETEDGRRVMVDRGFMPDDAELPAPPAQQVRVVGNLLWPDETDGYTPEPDREAELWFARDVDLMAEELATEPLLIVAREATFDDGPIDPLPADTSGIPNDHAGYAATWFSLAAIWLAMSLYLFYRSSGGPDTGRQRKG